jgi:hypothetical protein
MTSSGSQHCTWLPAWHGMAVLPQYSIQCCLASCCQEVHLHAHSICSAMVALWNLWLHHAHAHFVLSVLFLLQCSLAAGCTEMGRHRSQVPRGSLLLLVRLMHTLHCKDMLCKHDLAQLQVAIMMGGPPGIEAVLWRRKMRQSNLRCLHGQQAPSYGTTYTVIMKGCEQTSVAGSLLHYAA